MIRCDFTVFATRYRNGAKEYRHVCVRCGLRSGWTKQGNPERIAADCVKTPTDGASCIHRGHVIGERTCETCGQRGQVAQVFQCELLALPCVLRPWTNRRSQMPEVACVTCRDRTLPDGSKPWELIEQGT